MSLNSFRSGLGRIGSTPAGKATLFTIGAVLVFSLVWSGLGNNLSSGGGAAAAQRGTDTVATVNGEPITRAEYAQALQSITQRMGGQGPGLAQNAFVHSLVLDQLVSAKLQLARAQQRNITVSDKDIAQARQQVAQQDGLAQKLGLPPTASVADINDALAKQGAQPLEQIFPDDSLRQDLILNKLRDSFAKPVTEQEARDFYKEYHTRHILIDNKKVSDVQAQNKAQQILAKVKAPGADFATLARQYSDDPGTKASGGDDGWIGQDTPDPRSGQPFKGYIPEFVKAATALRPGEVTPTPVKTPQFGYFLIKLEAVRENLPKDFDKNKAKYIAQIKDQQQQTAYQDFLNGLKNDSANKIIVQDPALRGDQALAQAQQGDPTQRPAKLQAAVAAYQAALKNAPAAQAGEINASLAQAYQGLNQIPQAVAALKAAVDATHDQDLEMALGNLYVRNKDAKDAIAQFEAASQQAWNDPNVHQQLIITYATLKRPDLAAKERTLYQQIQKRQQQANAPLPGAMPLTMPPGGQGATVIPPPSGGHAGTITVKPAAGHPAPPAPKPGQ
ncbi:MAG: peptidylprolyl isomerase [Armatimonadetes bacterium]|nr:peptidylprolyl isomerase [Armatimonadota bacterium]